MTGLHREPEDLGRGGGPHQLRREPEQRAHARRGRVRSRLWIRALFNTSADCPTNALSTSTRSSTTVEDPSTSTTPNASPSCVIGKIPSETPTVPWIGKLTGCCVRKAVRRLLDRRRPEPSSGPSLTITRSRPAASGTATRTVAEAPPAAARIQRAHDVAARTTSNRCGARLDVRKRTCLRAHRADQTCACSSPVERDTESGTRSVFLSMAYVEFPTEVPASVPR